MKLQNLFRASNLILQIVWGEKIIEFHTEVVENGDEGVYVRPYMHEGTPLVLNIEVGKGVICNIFGDNPENGKRISWRNIELHSVTKENQLLYYLTTSAFNSNAQIDERHKDERVKVTKTGTLYDAKADKDVDIRIHDVSDCGIAFYAPASFQPESNIFTIHFDDVVNDQGFHINIRCKIMRVKPMTGMVLYGCRITDENEDYLLYGCLMRLKNS